MRSAFGILFCLIFFTGVSQNTQVEKASHRTFETGMELLREGNLTAARRAFEDYAALGTGDLKSVDAQYYAAYCALALYHQDGESLISRFVAENPSHHKADYAYFELAGFYFDEKNYAKAVEYYDKVDRQKLSISERYGYEFKYGYSLFARRQFKEALPHFNEIKRSGSEYAAASNYYAGYIEYQEGRYDEALTDLRTAENEEAYKRTVPSMIAKVLYQKGDYDQLITYGEGLLDQAGAYANAPEIYLVLGEAYYSKDRFEDAAGSYKNYIEATKNRKDPGVMLRSGISNFKIGNDQVAIDQLKQAALSPDETGKSASYYLGMLYIRESNLRFASNAMEKAMKSADASIKEESWFLYGKINTELGESNLAIRTLQEFLDQYPDSKFRNEAEQLLSQAFLHSNNYSLAIEYIEKLQSRSPAIESAYQAASYMRGVQLFNDKKFRLSLTYFDKSLINPVDRELRIGALFLKGEAYSIARKYEEAIAQYSDLLRIAGNSDSEYVIKSYYGRGYAYFNTKDYDNALINFRRFVTSSSGDSNYYQDAVIRLADCYYVAKDYPSALTNYQKAINERYPDRDYAFLQSGIIKGLQNNYRGAIIDFNTVLRLYPTSRHYDDALFEKGLLELQQGNYTNAVSIFDQLEQERPKSKFIPYALIRRATASSNLGKHGDAGEDYKKFLVTFPTHKEANNALLGLQQAMALSGDTGDFQKILDDFKEANPDQAGLETVEYESAKNRYFNQEYQAAIQAFDQFITNYPEDPNVYEARYYIAESHYRLRNLDQALEVYNTVLEEDQITQIPRVLQRVADLEYLAARYDNAVYFYRRLSEEASNKRQEYNAWSGLMRSYFMLNQYDSTEYYAAVILERGRINANAETTAQLFIGKSAYFRGDYNGAEVQFRELKDQAKDANAAEANYLLAEIFHNKSEFEASNELLYELHANFSSYQEWYDRSYLLIAENFIGLEEYFQAMETLNSLIENSEFDEIKEQAKTLQGRIETLSGLTPSDSVNDDNE